MSAHEGGGEVTYPIRLGVVAQALWRFWVTSVALWVRLLSDSVLCELFQCQWDAHFTRHVRCLWRESRSWKERQLGATSNLRPNKVKPSLGTTGHRVKRLAPARLTTVGPRKLWRAARCILRVFYVIQIQFIGSTFSLTDN